MTTPTERPSMKPRWGRKGGAIKTFVLGIITVSLIMTVYGGLVDQFNQNYGVGFNESQGFTPPKTRFKSLETESSVADQLAALGNITKSDAIAELPTGGGFFSKGAASAMQSLWNGIKSFNSLVTNSMAYILECPECATFINGFIMAIQFTLIIVIIAAIFRWPI